MFSHIIKFLHQTGHYKVETEEMTNIILNIIII